MNFLKSRNQLPLIAACTFLALTLSSCRNNDEDADIDTNKYIELTVHDDSLGKEVTFTGEYTGNIFADLDNNGKIDPNEKLTKNDKDYFYFTATNKKTKIYGEFKSIFTPKSFQNTDLTKYSSLRKVRHAGPGTITVDANNNIEHLSLYNNPNPTFDFSPYKKATTIYYNKGLLEKADFSQNPALEFVDVSNNQLASLTFAKNKNLTRIDCYLNFISEAQMQLTVNSIGNKVPGTVTYIVPYAVNYPNKIDKNVMTKAQVAQMSAKGWDSQYLEFQGENYTIGHGFEGL
ncbi:MAG: hypothetical protein J0I53_07910 [Chryseobacterium sp.]|nr:hypothetical protein [Chryseobacterium sp.]